MIAVAIAVGISVVAASYTSSAVGVGEGPEALRVGADLRVVTIPADVTPSAISAAAGADAAMEGRQLVASMPSTRSERDRVPILALESQQIREVMTAIPGVVDPGEWSERLSRPSSAGQIPALVSQDVADDLGLIEGDSLALDASSPSLTADLVVAGVVPVIPGTPGSRGFLVDLARLAVSVLRRVFRAGRDAPIRGVERQWFARAGERSARHRSLCGLEVSTLDEGTEDRLDHHVERMAAEAKQYVAFAQCAAKSHERWHRYRR